MKLDTRARARVYDREWKYLERGISAEHASVEVSDSADALIRAKLLDLRPELSRHFDLELSDCQALTYLVYKPGDFFQPHQDESHRPDAPKHVTQRLSRPSSS